MVRNWGECCCYLFLNELCGLWCVQIIFAKLFLSKGIFRTIYGFRAPLYAFYYLFECYLRLELLSAASRATLTDLSCSPNFPSAQYLDIRTLTHVEIVKMFSWNECKQMPRNKFQKPANLFHLYDPRVVQYSTNTFGYVGASNQIHLPSTGSTQSTIHYQSYRTLQEK